MDKNIKLLFCILGSTFLTLLKSELFMPAGLALLNGSGYGENLFGLALYNMINLISFIGFVLLIIFSSILIIINANFREK